MINTTLCYIQRGSDYLMLHRVKKHNDLNHDKWIGIGGKFEDKESPEDCLLLEAREEIPVFGKNGYYLSDGTYVLWSKNVEKPELMRRYQILEYNAVADRNNRVDRLFTLMP